MKILFISNLYPPNVVGGYERLCFEVAEAMAMKGHEVSILTSSYGSREKDYAGQKVERSLKLLADHEDIYRPFQGTGELTAEYTRHNNSRVSEKIASENPDLVFIWNLFFLNSSIIQSIINAGKKNYFLLTDNWLISFLNPDFWSGYYATRVVSSQPGMDKVKSWVRKVFSGKIKKDIFLQGKAIFPSRFMQELYCQAGFGFEDHVIIPHGVNLPAVSSSNWLDRSRSVQNNKIKLLFGGRIVKIKGVHTIIQALPEIAGSLPGRSIELTLVGDSSDKEYLKSIRSMIDSMKLQHMVRFLPPVEEGDLFQLFQEHDIYLFPSLYEPFSLTLIHALHSGIPTVASDAGGNPEIVINGRNGMLFRKGNARELAGKVVKLANSPDLRRSLSVKARDVGQYYTFTRMADDLEACLGGTK